MWMALLLYVLCSPSIAVDSEECEGSAGPARSLASSKGVGCDLERVNVKYVTRRVLAEAKKPLIIQGITDTWPAMQRWTREALLQKHADQAFHLHPHGNATLGTLLRKRGQYSMGHTLYPPQSCYSDPWRPYTPMLRGVLKEDYSVPSFFKPQVTFQMGIGTGKGIGVPPESHPSSWFAMVVGTKRWALHPPDAGTAFNGEEGTAPREELLRRGSDNACSVVFKAPDSLHCDQRAGEILWLPMYWWHETCGVEDFSVGVGGLTYDGCCHEKQMGMDYGCRSDSKEGVVYTVHDIKQCGVETACDGLPF